MVCSIQLVLGGQIVHSDAKQLFKNQAKTGINPKMPGAIWDWFHVSGFSFLVCFSSKTQKTNPKRRNPKRRNVLRHPSEYSAPARRSFPGASLGVFACF